MALNSSFCQRGAVKPGVGGGAVGGGEEGLEAEGDGTLVEDLAGDFFGLALCRFVRDEVLVLQDIPVPGTERVWVTLPLLLTETRAPLVPADTPTPRVDTDMRTPGMTLNDFRSRNPIQECYYPQVWSDRLPRQIATTRGTANRHGPKSAG